MFYIRFFNVTKIFSIVFSITLVIFPFFYIYIIKNGYLEELVYTYGINTSGRIDGTTAWNYLLNLYDFSILFVGNGLGKTIDYLEYANIPFFVLLHNDFLSTFIEIGFIIFFLWLCSFQFIKKYTISNYHKNCINVLILFMFFCFLTDNIYMYISFIIPFYSILLKIVFDDIAAFSS